MASPIHRAPPALVSTFASRTFVLRLWCEDPAPDGPPHWRGTIKDAVTGETWSEDSVDRLCTRMKEALQNDPKDDRLSGAG